MIKSSTKLLCILGNPVKHSKSPLMHNKMIEKYSLDMSYMAFDVQPENLGDAVKGLKALGFHGGNVTIPHKENVIKYLDGITDEARAIGAVNTLFMKDGKLMGDNTDGRGFIISLMNDGGFDPKGKTAFVLGAGGASKAICVKLAMEGALKISLFDISEEKSLEIKNHISNVMGINTVEIIAKEKIDETAENSDLIVNCTPVGMKDEDPLLVSEKCFHSGQYVFDLIYNPQETKLLRTAKSKGAVAINGQWMLIYQGALAFEKWTGHKADTALMFEAISDK